jgi:acyl-coenzyme A thioesterase PaaI-like protein
VERTRASLNRQGFMRTLGAVLEPIEAGTATISCGFDEEPTQQHGLFHGGVVASLADVACGYAALSMAAMASDMYGLIGKCETVNPTSQMRFDGFTSFDRDLNIEFPTNGRGI